MNKKGYESIDEVLSQGTKPLSPEAFEAAANETEALILDVRKNSDFIESHVPNSIFIGLDGDFAPWVGELIVDVKTPILLVVSHNRVEEAVTRLSRIGFDNTLGYLEGGLEAWKKAGKETDQLHSIPAEEFAKAYPENKDKVFDVRKKSEYLSEHVEDAHNVPLGFINDHLAEFNKDHMYIHCAGGYRSVIAASILKSRGIHNLTDVKGGFKAIKDANVKTTDYVCPSTL